MNMNLINNLDYKMRNPAKDIEQVKMVHTEIEKKISRERPDPNDFRGIVPDHLIDEDIKTVESLKKQWKNKNDLETSEVKMKADIAEYIIYKNIGTWIDQKATPLIMSEADDYLRGIDIGLESEQSEENSDINHIGIGIDVALTTEQGRLSESIERKKTKMKNMLQTGKLTEARYVSGGSFEGTIKNLPYTMLVISNSHVENLFSSVLKSTPSEKEKNHIIKHIIAYQILRQLGTYYQVSKNRGDEKSAYEYGRANNFANDIFGHLLAEMQENSDLWQTVENDRGVKEIEELCEELEKSLT